MKTLYAKVLIWFLATVAITGLGLLWVTAMLAPDSDAGPPFRRPFAAQMEAAVRAHESGGAAALRAHLETLERVAGVNGMLTDARGVNLADGSDQSALVARFAAMRILPPQAPLRREGQFVFAMPSPGGRYWFFSSMPGGPPRRGFPLLMPAHLWVFASVGLLSLWLAHHVTSPVRNLTKAVERFGAGELSRRVEAGRADEVGQLATSFNTMADRIQSLVDSQRRLLADLSHELRSPLTRLGLAVELAREGGDREAALDRIQREADRLNALVGGLLQVTRGEADPGAIRFEEMDLDPFAAAIVEDARLDAGKRCEIVYTGESAVVNGDAELLRRAIENVLRNAVRFAPEGSAIDVALRREGSGVTVSVRDRGRGAPVEALPHLFEAFYRAEGGGGFGLGLSIAQRALELHHGRIAAENANPGLRVSMWVPAA